MSWNKKKRGGPNRYYYRSLRKDGKAINQYLGRGPAAEAAAQTDEARRAARLRERAAAVLLEGRLAEIALATHQSSSFVGLLFQAILLLNGYHLHHRQWRRRHGPQRQRAACSGIADQGGRPGSTGEAAVPAGCSA